jgi:dTDP-4-dehydrorhamnose reductase
MKKIYIAGCGGMLGDAFYRHFNLSYEIKCTDINIIEPWLGYCDIRDRDSYLGDVAGFRPDYLFHLGAHTDLEFCESNPDDAYRTNTMAVENAVHISRELDIPILYISTAGIFDGSQTTFDDWDEPNPLGVYARSKYAGERYVREHAGSYLVCRPGWMMGGGPRKDKKFIGRLMGQLKEGKKELFAVKDRLGSPTYARDFARNVEALLDRELWGVYNMMCAGITSKYEVAKELLSILGLSGSITMHEVSSDYFKKEYFAPRPSSEMLINKKLDDLNLNLMRDWKVSLRDYIDEYYR